jgi:hypothetical protein
MTTEAAHDLCKGTKVTFGLNGRGIVLKQGAFCRPKDFPVEWYLCILVENGFKAGKACHIPCGLLGLPL